MKKLALVLGCLVVLTSFGCSDEDSAIDLTKANREQMPSRVIRRAKPKMRLY